MSLKNKTASFKNFKVGIGDEMERDAILSHSALQFLKETMFEKIDAYSFHISDKDGLLSAANDAENKYICMSK